MTQQIVEISKECLVLGTLPSGYTELEYIESTGTQYIDLGDRSITNKDSWEVKFNSSSTTLRFITGENPSAPSANSIGVWMNGGTLYMQNGANTRQQTILGINNDVILKMTPGERKITAGGTTTTFTYTEVALFSHTNNLYVMWATADSGNRMFYGRLYSYKHWDANGVKDIDLIPAKNSSNVVGMYDLVTNTFFTNAGTDEFTAGPEAHTVQIIEDATEYDVIDSTLPSEYTHVEYLQSSRTQYIDTGINAQSGVDFELKYQINDTSNGGIIGARVAGTRFWNIVYSGIFEIGVGGDNVIQSPRPAINTTYIHKLVTNSTGWKAYYDGVEVRSGNDVVSPTGINGSIYLFKINNVTGTSYTASCKMYYCKIWQDSELVRDFVPVKRNSDDVLGMYDLVSGTFYTNSGSGTFTAGPEISGQKTIGTGRKYLVYDE